MASRQRRRSTNLAHQPIGGATAGVVARMARGKKFGFVLTHDVEGAKGLERCRALAELEIDLGFRSSFNFVPEGEYARPPHFDRFLLITASRSAFTICTMTGRCTDRRSSSAPRPAASTNTWSAGRRWDSDPRSCFTISNG